MSDARGDIPNRPRRVHPDGDRPGHTRGHEPGVSRDELDRLFDRELDAGERRELTSRLRHDPHALDDVIDTRRMLGMLRQPVQTPDLTARVLDGVGQRRGFLSARLRRRVRSGRWAVAAMFVLSLGAVALAHRLYPGSFSLETRPTPVADLGDAVQRDSADGRERFIEAVRELGRVEITADAVRKTGRVSFAYPADHQRPHDPAHRAGLAEFRVEFASGDAPRTAVTGFGLTLPTCSDAEILAVGRTPVLAPFDGASAVATTGGDATDWAESIDPGLVPLSAGAHPHTAYVGSLDPFRDATLERRLREVMARPAATTAETSPEPEHPGTDGPVSPSE